MELTTENWLDYIGVCSYTTEDVEKDAFGEIISVTTTKNYVLGAKNNQYYHLRDFVIALKDKSTEELTIYANSTGSNAPSVKEDFQLDQYVCTRIKGTLFLIDVPEEAIKKAEGIGLYFTVRYSDLSYGPPMDCFIRGTDGYEVADYPYGLFSD